MNREIKFRGKSINSVKWLYGYLGEVKGKVLQSIYKEKVIFENLEWFNTDNFGYVVNDYMVDEETIGQFTGLYDRNQNPIYEGDIVRSCKYKNIKHIVSYDDKVAAFVAVCIDKNAGTSFETKCHITQDWIDNYPKEVIGNIYDNKDLLNEE